MQKPNLQLINFITDEAGAIIEVAGKTAAQAEIAADAAAVAADGDGKPQWGFDVAGCWP